MSKSKRLFAACVGCATLFLPSPAFAQQVQTLDLFGGPIDNAEIYQQFETTATRLMLQEDERTVEEVKQMLQNAPRACPINIGELSSMRPNGRAETYRHIVKSTVVLGELFNCGRCDKTHVRFSGGVLISNDGLMLTNYHVLETMDVSKAEGIYAMTWDGKVWPIEEVLFADKGSDVALVRLKGNGYKFYSAPLTDKAPAPMEPVRVVSHPAGEYFVMTHGEVSRYVTTNRVRQQNHVASEHWMEITAPFGGGSSGCGVFNENGEVVGLVSRLHPLMRSAPSKAMAAESPKRLFVEMLLRRCVPFAAIRDGFEPGK
jgi:S1-C subfamily serine protease